MTNAKHAQHGRTSGSRTRRFGSPGKHSAPQPAMRRFLRAPLLVAGLAVSAVALLTIGGGSAYAYFTGGPGSGSGSGSSGTLQTVTIQALAGGDAPTSTLVPSGSADVILRVNNPNARPVTAYSVVGNGSITADSGHPACTTTGVTFTAPTAPMNLSIPTGQSLVHLPNAAAMSTASQSACQGATFHIPVTLTVRT